MGFYPTSQWILERIGAAADVAGNDLGAVATKRRFWLRRILLVGFSVTAMLLITLETRTSWVQSRVLAFVATKATYAVLPGSSPAVRYPDAGPYDQRLGYSRGSAFSQRLQHFGYDLTAQARGSQFSTWLARAGLYPIYHEKAQAGLEILDRQNRPSFSFSDPRQVYPDFDAIPPLVVRSLLFIENRGLLNPDEPYHNPVIEWDRLARASVDFTIHQVDRRHPVIGGSTLASQLEKMRHSPEGRTHSPTEKLKQITSASLRIFQDGPRTLGRAAPLSS